MRKLLIVLVVLATAVPAVASAAAARPLDKGDGTLAVKNAQGRVIVNARGAILGRLDEGGLTVLDLNPNGNADPPQVFGYDQKPVVRPNGTIVYTGSNIRFRLVGGAYSVAITGKGINLSAVGRGTVQGIGITDGLFSTDGQPFRSIAPSFYLDVFGTL
jgi:hypothetical protein